ncbi:MAG: sugar transferase [Clostridia bacterium]|nr:sugar transferase [Clostridia bacterium]
MERQRRDYRVVPKKKPFYECVKRLFDVWFYITLLLLLAPLFLVVILLVRSDGGPAFYCQTRLGKDGKPFRLLKFRSMIVNADSPEMLEKVKALNEQDGPAFKSRNDPRITKIGRFIRKMSIDELPQLINILRNEMSVVGPRPPLEAEVEGYDDYQKQRLGVKQGLTCFWQCSGRNNLNFAEWVELDLDYIEQRSVWTDFKILLKTVPAVLTGEGAS